MVFSSQCNIFANVDGSNAFCLQVVYLNAQFWRMLVSPCLAIEGTRRLSFNWWKIRDNEVIKF